MNRNHMRYCVKVPQWEIRFAQWETGKYQRVAFSVEGQCICARDQGPFVTPISCLRGEVMLTMHEIVGAQRQRATS